MEQHPLQDLIGSETKIIEALEVHVEIVPPEHKGGFAHGVGQRLDLCLLRVVEVRAVASSNPSRCSLSWLFGHGSGRSTQPCFTTLEVKQKVPPQDGRVCRPP